ncbi:hypothetical protein QC763_0021320 [Podospora pseudopauciseta]|uniref:Uncharacterized protein n=1 Tax=Podospora pseudopauciseta TaxID=2093780 RepID=A0ABR0I1Q0_9PEZI|nr:hypothetical protein QC763_0021320 [Podospora pseudopauciseta]
MEQYNNIQGRKAARQSYESKSRSLPVRIPRAPPVVQTPPGPPSTNPPVTARSPARKPALCSLPIPPRLYIYPVPIALRAKSQEAQLSPATDFPQLRACTNAASCSR